DDDEFVPCEVRALGHTVNAREVVHLSRASGGEYVGHALRLDLSGEAVGGPEVEGHGEAGVRRPEVLPDLGERGRERGCGEDGDLALLVPAGGARRLVRAPAPHSDECECSGPEGNETFHPGSSMV